MKKVMFYCQHVLGMGHFMRSMTLVQGLVNEFQVCFLNGGEIVPGFSFPASVEVVNLPPLKSDATFKTIRAADGQCMAEITATRTERLLAEFERFQPDLVIIELFPFGRKKFAFELGPLLARIRLKGGLTKVVCSLRDILVSRPDQARYEGQVCDLMNRYFDALLIHADPRLQRLEETFSRVNDLQVDTHYTGYVVQPIPTLTAFNEEALDFPPQTGDPFILASIGGGRVGFELLLATVKASAIIRQTLPHQILIFTGPYLPDEQFLDLQREVAPASHITLRRYTTNFVSYMAAADLSISMAGYNTCMNILTTGTRALVLPFTGGQNNEQTIRANKLASLGIVGVIQPDELHPSRLAEKIVQHLETKPASVTLNIQGVENTVTVLTSLLQKPSSTTSVPPKLSPLASHHQTTLSKILEAELRPCLEQLQNEERQVDIFLRDDDIDEDEETLRHLLDVCLARSVPLNLEIIPGRLTTPTIKLLGNHKRFHPTLLELNQHGWQHHNHEPNGRKCEFGISRTFEQQLQDIGQGKRLLEEIFEDRFYPAFTPPWNRCTEDTLRVLDQLGFEVFSKTRGKQPVTGYRFQEISISLDLFRWNGGATLRPANELLNQLINQLGTINPIGIMLHHKVMDAEAFYFLDMLLAELKQYSNLRFHTFQSLHLSLETAAGRQIELTT